MAARRRNTFRENVLTACVVLSKMPDAVWWDMAFEDIETVLDIYSRMQGGKGKQYEDADAADLDLIAQVKAKEKKET